jgi:hypothetical protein
MFQKDEKVLCFHHELLYEAKITEYKHFIENDKNSPFQYQVHYKGWKNTYVPFSIVVAIVLPSLENPLSFPIRQFASHTPASQPPLFPAHFSVKTFLVSCPVHPQHHRYLLQSCWSRTSLLSKSKPLIFVPLAASVFVHSFLCWNRATYFKAILLQKATSSSIIYCPHPYQP